MLRDTASLAAVRAAGRPTDEDLVVAVREGDDRAFERLYGRYHRRIVAFVHGMVQDHARAEDITQEVFVSALRRMRETDRAINFKPWVYEIAKNACIDAFRRSRRAELVSIDIDGDGADALEGRRLAGREPTPDVAVDQKLELETLQGAFGGLSDVHHEILIMRELEGLSYKEIGDRLGMTRPSVESTLFRARRRLEEEFAEIASGERCRRVQALLAGGAPVRLGLRDEKRMARHVSYCQPCRREAIRAGVDVAALSPTPLRKRIAAWLPLPVVLRRWGGGGDPGIAPLGAAAHYAEPVTSAWVKAAATAATVALAAGGVGAATDRGPLHLGGAKDQPVVKQERVSAKTGRGPGAPGGASTSTASTGGGAATVRPISAGGATRGGTAAQDRPGATQGSTGGASAGSGSAPGVADAGGAGAAATNAAGAAVASSPAGGPSAPVRNAVTGATGTVGGAQQTATRAPRPLVPKVVDAVKGTVGAVADTVGTVTRSGGSGSAPPPSSPPANPVTQTVGAVQGTVDTVAGTVTGTTPSAGTTPSSTPAPSTGSPDPGTLGKVSGAVSGLLGGGH